MAASVNKVDPDEISVRELILKSKEIWHFLWSKWIIILVFGLLGGALGLTKALLTTPKYVAKLSFVVANERSNPLGDYSGMASIAGIDVSGGGGSLFTSDNLIELMKSRRMIEGALLANIEINGKATTLLEHYLDYTGIRKSWKKEPEFANIQFVPGGGLLKFSRVQDSIIGDVYQDISKQMISIVKPEKKLSLIVSTCTSTDEVFSKKFLEELNKKVSEFYIETKTRRLKQNVDILQMRADSLAGIITSSTIGIATLTDQNVNPARAIVMAGRSRKQVDLQVAGTVYGEVVKNLELAKVTLQRETPLIQIIDSPVYPLDVVKLGKLKGIIFGGILGGFLILAWLLGRRYYFDIMKNDTL